MEAIECSHPDCHCQLGLVSTDMGYLCGIHVQAALDICRGEQRLMECEDKLKTVSRERDEWKRIAGQYRETLESIASWGDCVLRPDDLSDVELEAFSLGSSKAFEQQAKLAADALTGKGEPKNERA